MATTTVLVTQLTGQAWIRDADGNLTPLRTGMRIPVDAQLVTASGSTVQLQADGQPPMTVGENQNVALNKDVFEDVPAAEAAVPAAADAQVDGLIAAINQGQDPLADLEPTAAVLAGGGGAGSSFTRLSSVVEVTSPLALAYPRGTSEEVQDRTSGAAAVQAAAADTAAPTEPATYAGQITLSAAAQVIEGNLIVVTATVNNPPVGSDLVITLTTGQIIIIPVGSTTGSVEISTRPDEAYLQGTDTLTFEVGGTTGGGYTSIDTGSPASTDVVDDGDQTVATLTSAGEGNEDAGSITYTVTLNNATQGAQDFKLTLSNGQEVTITVAAGAATGTVTVGWGTELPPGTVALEGYPDSDVFKEDNVSLTVDGFAADGSGGNFEDLDVVNSSTPVVIGDSINTTTATLTSAGEGNEDAGSITYTVTLDNATQGAQNFSFQVNGQTVNVTVAAGATKGTVTLGWGSGLTGDAVPLAGYPNSDVLKEPDASLVATDFKAVEEGGNFEYLDVVNESTPVVIGDSIDTTTATLTSEGAGNEDNGSITYTVTLDNATQGAQNFSFQVNGQTVNVTVAAGATKGTVTLGWGSGLTGDAVPLAGYPNSDVLKEPDASLVATDFKAVEEGGNFEYLDVVNESTPVVIGDSIDTTTATLTSEGAGNEDNGSITYTVTLDNATQGAQNFSFQVNGQTVNVTVAAGATKGTVTLGWGSGLTGDAVPLAGYPNSDVLKEPDASLVATDFKAVEEGGNFEYLDVVNESTPVVIGDSIDTTTATLTSEGAGNEDNGSITYTVTLDNATQGAQNFSFQVNGQTVNVTVAAGATKGTVTLGWGSGLTGDAVPLAGYPNSDVLKEPDASLVATDFKAVEEGGNFEYLDVVNESTPVVIGDSIDTTTATLTSEGAGNEDNGSITYTVTLDNATQGAQNFSFQVNGQTVNVTVAAGATKGTVTLGWGSGLTGDAVPLAGYPNSDVLKEPDASLVATDFKAVEEGGNFEYLDVVNESTPVVIGDSIDTTTATLTSEGAGNEDNGSITYTVTLDNATQGAQNFSFQVNGQTVNVTVAAGATKGTVTLGWGSGLTGDAVPLAGYPNSDVLKEPDASLVATDFKAVEEGGNFEYLDVVNESTPVVIGDSIDTTTATLTSEGAGNEDNGSITYTVTLDNATQGAQNFSFQVNGQTVNVTVAAGATKGTVTLGWGSGLTGDAVPLAGYPNSDVLKEPDASLVATDFKAVEEGGNFEYLDVVNESTPVVIGDSIDTTTATLTSEGAGNEDNGSITYTVTLDNATQGAQNFSFQVNGQTVNVTVAAGATKGTVTLGWGSGLTGDAVPLAGYPNSDVLKEPDASLVATDFKAVEEGGNFEYLDVVNESTPVVIGDSIDTTTATLTSEGAGNEDNGSITYTVTLDNATQGAQNFSFQVNGQTVNVTVAAGATKGTVTLGWGSGLTGDAVPLAGYPNSDVLKEPDASLVATDFKAVEEGGNFEYLDVVNESTPVVIGDSIDTTTATLTSEGAGNEDNGSITYTVTLDNATQGAQNFSFQVNGQTVNVTVAAGATKGTVTLGWGSGLTGDAVPLAGYPNSDVLKEPDANLVATDFKAVEEGGNFEYLDVVNESTPVVIGDSIDTTTVTLSDSTVLVGGLITITATVDHAPKTQLILKLNNGQEITIEANATSGTVSFANTNVGGSSAEYSVIDHEGGDYEALNTLDTAIIDTPVVPKDPLAVKDTGEINEGATQPATGNVLDNDTLGDGTKAEHSTTLISSGQGQYGTITLNPNGGYSYQLNNSNPDVKQMAAGDTLTDTFTYQVTDKDGSTSTATIIITINGQNNDAPKLIVDPNGNGNLQGGDANDVVIGDMGGDTLVPGATANIVLVLDASSSMSMDGSTRLATMKAAVVQALKDLAASGAKDVMVHLVTFGTSSKDLGSFLLTSNGVDSQKALDDAIAAVNNVPAYKGGAYEYTNYEAGLDTAYKWINSTSGTGTNAPPLSGASVNKLVFITDGDPTYAQDNSGKGINYFGTNNGEANAMAHVLGTFTSSDPNKADSDSEVNKIIGKGFSIDAVGIDVNSSTVNFLSQLEGAIGNGADSVSNGAQLSTVIGQLVGSSGGINAVGNDTIHGGAGNDVILGDSIYSTAADKGWAAYLAAHPNATEADRLNDIYANLTSANPTYAQEGTVGGSDTLYGGAGNDTIFGQAGDDKLYGGSGNDKLYGGTGKDLLVGGTGDDLLIGGAGADTFQWSLADLDGGVDRVMDFEVTKVTGTPWKYTVDFNDSITGFDNNSNENIKITINGKTYTGVNTGNTTGSSASASNTRFDSAANDLRTKLEADGYIVSYDTANNTFSITSADHALNITAATSTGSDTTGDIVTTQVGSLTTYTGDVIDLSDVPGNLLTFADVGGKAALLVGSVGGDVVQTIVFDNYTLASLTSLMGTNTAGLASALKSSGLLLTGADAVVETHKGTGGDDTLLGSPGDDILLGGAGNDTFKWNAGDQGSAAAPAKDVVLDFGHGKDKLDLSDLLQGEDSATADLSKFLHIDVEGSNTVLKVSSSGVLNDTLTNFDQKITLEGVQWNAADTAADQNALIKSLIDQGKLQVGGNH
ncbi:retention module-containing protein [Comamonas terrigena]|uniref:retention module-containing protein n=1 Tax=Comamonas terrigena TaxID=32013 RepID=UPI000E1838D1|nr:retention module-containing protein [Comamonas terrigena]SUY70294.1 Hemolysin, plasmid [Comamonas terrigena]